MSEHDFGDTISNSAIVGTLREVLETGFRAKSKSMMSFNKREAIKVAIVAIQNRTEAEEKIEEVREKLNLLKKDARLLDNECECVAIDYVTDCLIEILEGEK